jgi:hypothetical protein
MNKRYIGRAGVGICLFCLLLLSSVIAFSGEDKIVIKTENGIPVVYNPKNPCPFNGMSAQPLLKEELVIGRDQQKQDNWFSFLNALAVDDAGNIYTLDPKDVRIRVFDRDGKLLRSFGRKGQGPGEFSGPGGLRILPPDVLEVFDVLHSRLSYFTLDGKSLRDVPMARLGFFKIDAKGFVYLHRREPVGNKMVEELVKLDSDLKTVLKIHSFEYPWNPRLINPFPVAYLFEPLKTGETVWMITSEYKINVINSEGKLTRRIIKEYNPVKITAVEREKYLMAEPQDQISRQSRYEFPQFYPAANWVNGLIIDDAGWIYVRTYEKDDQGRIYHDIFDQDGRFVGRLCLPESERALVILKNKIYCLIGESEEGIPLVKRYRIIWK